MLSRKICIIGIKGNMGKRYASICKWLDIDYCGIDVGDDLNKINYLYKPTHYIVTTPTSTHHDVLTDLLNYLKDKPKVSILCEKPIIKTHDINKDMKIVDDIHKSGHLIYMVNNYHFVSSGNFRGLTLYDNYNSGGDDIAWDCIQLIHLAKGEISLKNDSPFWRCMINGISLKLEDIQHSYAEMICSFVDNDVQELWGYEDIILATRKVIAYEKRNARNSSKNRESEASQQSDDAVR